MAGPINNSPEGYFYWNALELSVTLKPMLAIEIYEIESISSATYWAAGKPAEIRYHTNMCDIGFKLSLDNGETFYDLGRDTTAANPFYVQVPPGLSGKAQIHVYSSDKRDVRSTSPVFTIGPQASCQSAIIGSWISPLHREVDNDSVWQALLQREWYLLDTRREVANLSGEGWSSTILPAGVPALEGDTVQFAGTVTEAIALGAELIVVSTAAADVSRFTSIATQRYNYDNIIAAGESGGARVVLLAPIPTQTWTPAQRAFARKSFDSLMVRYGNRVIDVYKPLVDASGGLRQAFRVNSYLNEAGHRLIYDKLQAAQLSSELSCLPVLGIFESASAATQLAIQVSPNPTQGLAKVSFEMPHMGTATLTLTDISGRVILSQQFPSLAPRTQSFPIETEGLAPGSYIVSIRTAEVSGLASHMGSAVIVVE